MDLKKCLTFIFVVLTAIFMLAACGGDEAATDSSSNDDAASDENNATEDGKTADEGTDPDWCRDDAKRSLRGNRGRNVGRH